MYVCMYVHEKKNVASPTIMWVTLELRLITIVSEKSESISNLYFHRVKGLLYHLDSLSLIKVGFSKLMTCMTADSLLSHAHIPYRFDEKFAHPSR